MIIFPAIDIKDGKVVRLKQGKFSEVTEYSRDPIAMAEHWVEEGAKWLHIVDLDGALTGHSHSTEVIKKIAGIVAVPIQVGGGIRTEIDIENYLRAGVKRIVLGTKAIEDKMFLKNILSEFPGQIVVSLDCANGFLTQRGWTSVTEIRAIDFVTDMEEQGLQHIVYTDIKKDGMLTGPNWDALEELLNSTKIPVIASGGISSIDDIRKLIELSQKKPHLEGAITGKAIYEGLLDLKEAIALCSPKG